MQVGQRSKTSKKSRSAVQLAKDKLKKAITNGTLHDLLWGKGSKRENMLTKLPPEANLLLSNSYIEDIDDTKVWNRLLTTRVLETPDPVTQVWKAESRLIPETYSENDDETIRISGSDRVFLKKEPGNDDKQDEYYHNSAKRVRKRSGSKVSSIKRKSRREITSTEPITNENMKEANGVINDSEQNTNEEDRANNVKRGPYAGIFSKPKPFTQIMRESKLLLASIDATAQHLNQDGSEHNDDEDQSHDDNDDDYSDDNSHDNSDVNRNGSTNHNNLIYMDTDSNRVSLCF